MSRKAAWKELVSQLRTLPQFSKQGQKREVELFLEIEAVLHLYETLCPQEEGRDARQAWALITGYFVQGINDVPDAQKQCLLLREQLRYVRTATAWRWWLKWYIGQPKAVRLYEFGLDIGQNSPSFRQKHYEVAFRNERLAVYAQLFTQPTAKPEVDPRPFAPAGCYHFEVEGSLREVEITDVMTAFAAEKRPACPLNTSPHREALEVTWDDLLATACELDWLEAEGQFSEPGHWQERLGDLRLTLLGGDTPYDGGFHIDGLFHLVGLLGVGKSTVIWLLTYYLACQKGKHVTVIVNTVVEAYRMAVWLRRLGVRAAPRLGKDRANHETKYGLANADALNSARLFTPNAPEEPILDWMPTPCALSGSQKEAIPIGSEPCRDLVDADGKKHVCPLLPVCPVHAVERDLVESQVWVANSMSFLYSSAPDGVGETPMRLLEAVYRVSDLIIIDEADRVQVQWDRAFAPTRPLVGSDDALLDRLKLRLAIETGGANRQKAARSSIKRLSDETDQANILAVRVFYHLRRTPRIVRWIRNFQITNVSIFKRLTRELSKVAPDEADREALKTRLHDEFRGFWNNPLRRESGALADWINAILGADSNDKRRQQELEAWLAAQMGWSRPFKGRQRLLLKKLDFALTITALIKRTNDIFFQIKWLEDELSLDKTSYELPDATINLVSDPPLGVLLGVRHVGRSFEGDLGTFNAVHYRGIGRWLLLNLPTLYEQQTSQLGPHVLLTSATSWLPGAVQSHLPVKPDAVLRKGQVSNGAIELHFRPVRTKNGKWIRVSGAGKYRELHLRQIVRALAASGPHTPSDLQKALDYWQKRDEPRRLLLVVSSYEQTGWVLDELNRTPDWKGRAARLLPDDAEMTDEAILRTREVERFKEHDADILIAPLMAIQRGFNILDEAEGALLGTAFFLVRPYPPPDDLSPQILSMNAWVLNQLNNNSRALNGDYTGPQAMSEFRKRAYQAWNRRLESGRDRISAMSDDYYAEFLKDQFVVIWQTIGRLLRGGRGAQVYFVDGAFSAKEGKRNMLLDWHSMLDALIKMPDTRDQYLANALYFSAWEAFHRAVENKEIF